MATGLFLFLGYKLPLESGLAGNTSITFTAPVAAEWERAIGSLGSFHCFPTNKNVWHTHVCQSAGICPQASTSPRVCYQQREQCGLLSCVGPSQGTWSVGCHPSPQPGSSGVFVFLLARVPHLRAPSLNGPVYHFPHLQNGDCDSGLTGCWE